MPTITAPANLCDLVAESARTTLHQMAVGTADRRLELSYHDLDIAVGDLAHRLRRLGLGPGDVIALRCDNSAAENSGDRRKLAARFGPPPGG